MGRNYKKIKYEEEGSYGSTELKYLYVAYSRSCDETCYYDERGNLIFCHGDRDFNLSHAIHVANTNWNDPRMEDLTDEDFRMITKNE